MSESNKRTNIERRHTRVGAHGNAGVMISRVGSGVTSDAIAFEMPLAKVVRVPLAKRLQVSLRMETTANQLKTLG